MKTKLILGVILILVFIFFPYIVLGIALTFFAIWGFLAFGNLFYMIITGKGRGNYDSLN